MSFIKNLFTFDVIPLYINTFISPIDEASYSFGEK